MVTAFPPRASFARAMSLILAVVLASTTCATPTDAPDPPGGPPGGDPPVPFEGSLQLTGPTTLEINQSELLKVTATDLEGRQVAPLAVWFTSSDPSIAVVSAGGVVTGRREGTAVISAARDSATDSISVEVDARMVLNPAAGWEWANHVVPTAGDTIQLEAQIVDVNGELLGPATATEWSSSNPAAFSVTDQGLVIAHLASQAVTISASTPGGPVSREFHAEEERPPTLVRLAHGAVDVGPITFKIHRHPDITLGFGEIADAMIRSREIYAQVEGIPAADVEQYEIASDVTWGPTLSLYAVHGPKFGGLVAGWSPQAPIPPGTSLVRLVQGGSMPVMYLRDPGGSTAGSPHHCYFDPGLISNYFQRPSGDFDLLMQTKIGLIPDPGRSFARQPGSAPDGQAMTLVLSGNSTGSAAYVAFIDP